MLTEKNIDKFISEKLMNKKALTIIVIVFIVVNLYLCLS